MIAVGAPITERPRTEPYGRDSRIRLPPWMSYQLPAYRLDRLALNKMCPSDPSDRLHNQHLPPPPKAMGGVLPQIRGSTLDADHPLRGSIFHADLQH